MTKTLAIEGMSCMHCVNRVQKALEGIEGVTKVVVTLDAGQAVVDLDREIADQVLIDAVDEAGYDATVA
mgnify:CR=1 FL=1